MTFLPGQLWVVAGSSFFVEAESDERMLRVVQRMASVFWRTRNPLALSLSDWWKDDSASPGCLGKNKQGRQQ